MSQSSQHKILQHTSTQLADFLLLMKEQGLARNIPNISWNTASFLIEKLRDRNIVSILEIGPANGFSTMMLALACPEAQITSIECSRHAFEELRHNVETFNCLKDSDKAPFLKGRSDKFTPSNEGGKISGGDVRTSGQGDLLGTNPSPVWHFTEIPYRPDLNEKAKELRKNMSGPEKKIWHTALKKNTFKGFRFLRQKPLLNYIVDFYCHELGLVIELDGFSHHGNEEYDRRRTEDLEKHGLTVARFSNDEVLFSFDDVCDSLANIVDSLQNKSSILKDSCKINPPPSSPRCSDEGTSFKKEVSVPVPANFPPKVTSDINQQVIGNFHLYYADARELLPAFQNGSRDVICKNPQSMLTGIPQKQFDFIFIDGAFRMTREFFDLSLPLLSPGGLFILDDAIKYRWKMDGFHEYLETENIPFELVQTDEDDGVMVLDNVQGIMYNE